MSIDVLVAFLLLFGVALALLAALGLQQFPDVFARMHAATKPATLGLLLIASAAAIHLADPGATATLGLVVLLQFITAPVAAHMISRAAYNAGTELSRDTAIDELAHADLTQPPAPRTEAAPRPSGRPDGVRRPGAR